MSNGERSETERIRSRGDSVMSRDRRTQAPSVDASDGSPVPTVGSVLAGSSDPVVLSDWRPLTLYFERFSSMTPGDEDREKAVSICTDCGELFTVWACQDGTLRPVSPHNACSCEDPSPRIVEEDDVFDDVETVFTNE